MSQYNLSRHALAMELLALKARISIVSKETGLSSAILRTAFAEMHHRPPSKGSIKLSPQFINKSSKLLKEATLYAFISKLSMPPTFAGSQLMHSGATLRILKLFKHRNRFFIFRMPGRYRNGWFPGSSNWDAAAIAAA